MGLDMYLNAKIYVPKQRREVPMEAAARQVHEEDQMNAALESVGVPVSVSVQVFSPGDTVEFIDNPAHSLIAETLGLQDPFGENGFSIQMQAAYWRKANQIFAWFEKHVAAGNLENVTDYEVEREQLQELVDDCKKVIATVVKGNVRAEYEGEYEAYDVVSIDAELVKELLPPREGFFFGTYDLDQWFVVNLESTVTMLERVLASPALTDADFTFRAWW